MSETNGVTDGGKMVVVVNDDRSQLHTLGALLKKAGLIVHAFEGVPQALGAMKSLPEPDLIITDLNMPEIDGWRFCRLLRSADYLPYNETPLLVVSATFAGENIRQITTALGANDFLSSPIDTIVFLEKVDLLLSGKSTATKPIVLVVDDNNSIRLLVRKTFENKGWEVLEAETATEGMNIFLRENVSTILIDYHLPDMLGDNLLEKIRKERPQAVQIMITGNTHPDLVMGWMQKGASGYVQKPFDPEYLVTLCENAQRESSLLLVEEILEARTRELVASEERYRVVYEDSPEMMLTLDRSGIMQEANRKWLEETRYAREEAIDKPFASILFGKGGVAFEREVLPEMWDKGEVREVPCRYIRKDGVTRNVLLSGRMVTEREGREVALCVMVDVTRSRLIEEERRALDVQIQQAQKYESLNVMAGSIAHNFNNLLMIVLGNLDLAKWDMGKESSLKESILNAEKAALRAAELSTMMLTYVGEKQMRLEKLNLSDIVEEMSNMIVMPDAKKTMLRFQMDLAPVMLNGDAAQVRQVVMNLVTNATEAMSEENGTIFLRTGRMFCDSMYSKQPFLKEELAEGEYVFFEVSDTGGGIPADIQDKVFDPFFTTKFMGRGLGLAAVLGIMRAHKGSVSIYSEEESGTTIKVLFPALPKTDLAIPSTVKKSADKIWKGNGKVLLVDDEPMILNVGQSMLARIGFDVITAQDGEEAVEIFKREADNLTCVLLDLIMPRMDGEVAFGHMRRIAPNVPVILSSGYTEDQTIMRFKKEDAPAGFIQKPFLLVDLREKMRGIIENKS